MIFFDTNILVYQAIDQDLRKQQKATLLIEKAISEICIKNQICKNINNIIHLKTAEKYCEKIITFDSDFEKLQALTNIEIQILGE